MVNQLLYAANHDRTKLTTKKQQQKKPPDQLKKPSCDHITLSTLNAKNTQNKLLFTFQVKWLAARLRLARLLEAKPMLPPTPLVLLLPCCARPSTPSSPSALTSDVTSRLDIERFQDQGLLSSVAVVELPIKARQLPDVAVASPILQAQVGCG